MASISFLLQLSPHPKSVVLHLRCSLSFSKSLVKFQQSLGLVLVSTSSIHKEHIVYELLPCYCPLIPYKNYLHHSFGQQLSSEELQHGLHDILPTLPQDVTMTMGQMEYCLGCNVGFGVASKHTGQVLNRLKRKMRKGLGSGKCLERRSLRPLPIVPRKSCLLWFTTPPVLVGKANLVKAFPTDVSPLPSHLHEVTLISF